MRVSMHVLQRADKVLGLMTLAALQPLRLLRRRPPAGAPRRLLLIKFWGLGSLQLLTPAARSLRRAYPEATLSLLTLAGNREFAAGLGTFDEILTLDVAQGGLPRILTRILALLATLRRARFDRVYDFEFFTRFSAVVAFLSGAPASVGFAARGLWRGRVHTATVPFNRYWHVARNFRHLAGGEDGSAVGPGDLDAFRCDGRQEAEAEGVLRRAGLDGEGPLVLLNANAGELALERRWPPASFAELARRLALEDHARVALLGSTSEGAWNEDILRQCGLPNERVANLAGRISLGATHVLFSHASLVVTNDSGPMHLAAAAGVPTLGLFGPETPVLYGPIGHRAVSLYRPPPCSPCINVHDNKVVNCYRGRPECMIGIEVSEVLTTARRMLRGLPAYVVPLRRSV